MRNLILGENNELHNRYLHMSGYWAPEKVDIGEEKVDFKTSKVDIKHRLPDQGKAFSSKTKEHISQMFDQFGYDGIFGRSAVVRILGLENSSVSKLLSKLLQAGVIEPVSGYGKGKYRFKRM